MNSTTMTKGEATVESHQVARQDSRMPMLCLTDEQVMHLVQQLPATSKKRVLRNLIAERDTWLTADAPDDVQTRLRNLLSKQNVMTLNRLETVFLKRLLEKKDAENSGVTRSFQFRQVASEQARSS